MSARGLTLRCVVSLCVLCGVLVLSSAPASAATGYAFSSSFPSAGSFDSPATGTGVAVDQSDGDVYVADLGGSRVLEFNSNGEFVLMFGKAVNKTKVAAFASEAEQDVCTETEVELGGECQDGTSGSGPGEFSGAFGVAVDNSTAAVDPSMGDVYVSDLDGNIDRYSPSGAYLSRFDGSETKAGYFESYGVAVDPSSGDVYVPDAAHSAVDVFTPEGKFVEELFSGQLSSPGGIAIDAHGDVYVTNPPNGTTLEFTPPLASATGTIIDNGNTRGVAVDPVNNDVYVDDHEYIDAYSETGVLLGQFGSEQFGNSPGVAVNGLTHVVYAVDASSNMVYSYESGESPETPVTDTPEHVTADTALLRGELNPGTSSSTGYYFIYNVGNSCTGGSNTAKEPELTAKGVTVSAEATGLEPVTHYTFCVVATNRFGTTVGPPQSLTTTPSQPSIEAQTVENVGSTEATVSALVDARELPTGYHVDYGTSTAYGSSTPEVSIGRPTEPIAVQVRLSDLQPGTLYHYHFTAKNAYLGTEGTDATFTTAQAVAAQQTTLPDNRAYELVSPPENSEVGYPQQGGGAKANVSGRAGGFRAATDGDGIVYSGGPPATGSGNGSGLTGQGNGNEYLATRGPNGWEARDIEPVTNITESDIEWSSFSDDLSVETFNTTYPIKAEPQAPAECIEQQQNTLYSNTAGGYRAVPKPSGVCGGEVVGFSADGAHILYFIRQGGIYDAVNGHAYPVDVMPDGEPESNPHAMFGGLLLAKPNPEGAELLSNDISADGSRIFWTSLKTEVTPEDPAGTTRLFARENDTQPQSLIGPDGECTLPVDACTVQLDLTQKGATGSSGGGRFWTASRDGSKVFFTDCSRLTADSTAAAAGGCGGYVEEKEGVYEDLTGNDLYEYDFSKPLGERLTDLTVDENVSDPLGADVQGVIGATEDGSYVYFVAHGVLTKGANSEGKEPVAGQPNLYMRHGGETTFIVTLAPGDDNFHGPNEDQGYFKGIGDWRGDFGTGSAEVAPEGHDVAFMSRLSLTGYENDGLPEVFVYDADTRRISCASCNPDGAPPVLPVTQEEGGGRGGFVTVSGIDTFRIRWINAEGSEIFFDTNQSLVSQDTNGVQDVYEWESDGTGGCQQSAGCISLLSTGTAPSNAYFVDASVNGDDAFFTTRALLVPQARDEDSKLYDARVGGGFPETSLACTGSGCQGVPPAPPIFATPSSATFSGVGNFEPPSTQVAKPRSKAVKCKRGFVKKHDRCVNKKPRKSSKRSKRGSRK